MNLVKAQGQWESVCGREIVETSGTEGGGVSTIFFCAHAVLARSSDGHKNVLSLIGYSHLLENR